MPINVCIAELAPDMLQQSFAAATIPKQPPRALLPSTRAAATLPLASLAWHPKGDGLEESRANGETAKPIVTGVAAWAEPHNTAVATAEVGDHSVIRIEADSQRDTQISREAGETPSTAALLALCNIVSSQVSRLLPLPHHVEGPLQVETSCASWTEIRKKAKKCKK